MFKLKKTQVLLRLLLITMAISIVLTLTAQFGGGQGTEADPWLIERVEHLESLRNYLGDAHSNKHYLQTQDIDLNIEPWNEGTGWAPIGTGENRFCGQYDGNGFVIDNLYINRPTTMRQGLFGDIENATISNLGITNANVSGQQYSGPLLGYARMNSTIRNCWSSGRMTGFNTSTGGLIGYLFREITVENCYSVAEVSGNNYVGGLIGMAFRNHTIRNCYAGGAVSGNTEVGGLIGFLTQDDSNVENCYSTGRVSGQGNFGGLFGINRGSTVVNSYWDMETSEQNQSDAGIGKRTEQMVYPYSDGLAEVYVRWDFESPWRHDPVRTSNNGYPYLYFQVEVIDLDAPEVTTELMIINDLVYMRLNWQLVENAVSYKIYSSDDPYAEDWGDPIAVVGENTTHYSEPIDEMSYRYYYVVASTEEVP